MKTIQNIYTRISLIEGIVLGICFTILFSFNPGLSFPLFGLLYILSVILPVLFVEKMEGLKRINVGILIVFFLFLISGLFLYRTNTEVFAIGFLTLPILYVSFMFASFNKDAIKNFGLLSFCMYPAIVGISWFVDLFKFFSGYKSEKGSSRTKSIINRLLIGLLLSIPFVVLFIALLLSADSVFAKVITDFLQKTFFDLFKDFDSTMETIGRVFLGLAMFVFITISNYSIFNRDSFVNDMAKKLDWISFKNWKRNWDVVITSGFMFFINLIFVSFVIFQFVYLFGGDANVVGLKANFTYADYARKGFFELIVVSIFSYIILFVLNFKVSAVGLWQKVVYRGSHILMAISVLVMSYSANMRLMLYESVYGYTGTRLFVHAIILAIVIMYLFLYLSLIFKKGEQANNVALSILSLVLLAFGLLFPFDYVSSKLNYQRYLSSGKIDVAYITSRSNEAIPIIVDMVNDTKVGDNVKKVLRANLENRKDNNSYSGKWQEYNLMEEYNRKLLNEVVKEKGAITSLENSIYSFIEEYIQLLKDGKYDEAYTKYWSSATNKVDFDNTRVVVVSFEIDKNTDVPITFMNYGSVYLTGNLRYAYDIAGDGKTVLTYTTSYEGITVVSENGEWKIQSASVVTLGTLGDKEELKGLKHLGSGYYYDTKLWD